MKMGKKMQECIRAMVDNPKAWVGYTDQTLKSLERRGLVKTEHGTKTVTLRQTRNGTSGRITFGVCACILTPNGRAAAMDVTR